MTLFDPAAHARSPRHARIYAAYEIAHTVVDFAAALLFLIGSILFFWPAWETPAVWCFVIGSLCFAMKPTIKLLRELSYLRAGKIEELAAQEQA
ncbi:hypothetical protein LNKW23_33570 [Paralimibaculum aggregatum]|uniref:YrhK domain-containing protein n=1 Tax=Paralimibaculum aggregatum TaxID=3036245 RepID=A0ABQ6LRF6_9RHOB|nr:YrhK family protein [Limibaculum sp. NKW23]GMG84143.1 hypothetical protein LNKW23_33570 [Limibaculum sp. NKW23]